MLEITEQLARYGDRVVDEVPEVTGAEVRAELTPAVDPGARRDVAPEPATVDINRSHRNRWLAAAAVVAALAALAGALALGDEDHADDVITTPDPTVVDDIDPTFGYAPGWHELDAGPLSPRDRSEVIWTGTELLVFGGYRDVGSSTEWLSNGAVYDPTTRTWRPMSPMPPDLSYSDSVWAGTELIVLGAQDAGAESAWAYDPASDAWRELASPPPPPQFPTLNDEPSPFPTQGGGVWTGDRAVMLRPMASYDPSADAWTPIAAPPPFEVGDLAHDFEWTGTDAVFWTWDTPDAPLLAYRPAADEWQVLETPLDGEYLTIAASGGGASVVVAQTEPTRSAGLLDLDDGSWREIEHPGEMGCSSFTLGGRPVLEVRRPVGQGFICGDVVLLDDNDEWVRLPFDLQDPEGSRQLISTGGAVFEWTSYDSTVVANERVAGTSTLRLWIPPSLDELEPVNASTTTEAPTTTTTSTTVVTTTAAPTTTQPPPPTTVPAPPVTVPPWSIDDGTLSRLAIGAGNARLVMEPNGGGCSSPDPGTTLPGGLVDGGECWTAMGPDGRDDIPRLTLVAGEPFVVAIDGVWDRVFGQTHYQQPWPADAVATSPCVNAREFEIGLAMPSLVPVPTEPGQYWLDIGVYSERLDVSFVMGVDVVSALGVPAPEPPPC